MRMAILLGLLFALPVAVVAAPPDTIVSITVVSDWAGLSPMPFPHSQITLHARTDEFIGDGTAVPLEKVFRLAAAENEPALPKPDSVNLGITPEWLAAHADAAGQAESILRYSEGSPEQKQLFRNAFTNTSRLTEHLQQAFQSQHTDDYPSIHITLTTASGKTIQLETYSQNEQMLPWKLTQDGASTTTFNAHISAALYALLPPKFTNRERLALGNNDFGSLLWELGETTGSETENAWKQLGVQQKIRGALDPIRAKYTIRSSDINSYNDFDFNEVPNKGKHVDDNLHLDLWNDTLPLNLTVSAVLLYRNGKVEGLDELPARAAAYQQTALSFPWLRGYLNAHPKEGARLHYTHGVSLSPKALRIFAADMKAARHPELGCIDILDEVQPGAGEIDGSLEANS